MAYIGRGPTNSGEFIILDDISSGFDGSDTSFTLTVGTAEVTPAAANVTIALDGVIQTATSAYSVTGSTINFTEAPESGQEFHGVLAGQSQYISDSSITNQHISGTANISGSKINTDFGSQNIQIIHVTASGDISVDSMSIPVLSTMSSSIATRFDSRETDMTLATASIAAITASLGQPVNTDSNVTFGVITSGDINSSGTITATEIHTTFVSSSIAVASGSNNFGDATDDHHSFTGSLSVSGSGSITGSLTVNGDLVLKDNADFNGDLDVDGTTNLDVTDIDGAVDMASTLDVGDVLTVDKNVSAGDLNTAPIVTFKNSQGSGHYTALKFEGADSSVANTGFFGYMSHNTPSTRRFVISHDGVNRDFAINSGSLATFIGNINQEKAGNLRHTILATGQGEASLHLHANNSTGDSFIRFQTDSTTFAMGFDNSDGDKFILSGGSDPHSDSIMNIQPDGSIVTFDKAVNVNNSLIVSPGGAKFSVGAPITGSCGTAMDVMQVGHTSQWYAETSNAADRNVYIGNNFYHDGTNHHTIYEDEVSGIQFRAGTIRFRTLGVTAPGTNLDAGGGTERMRIAANGNVSIGTTTTNLSKLHVEADTNSTDDSVYPVVLARNENDDGNSFAGFKAVGRIDSSNQVSSFLLSDGANSLGFVGTNSNNVFQIRSNGTVSISIATNQVASGDFNDTSDIGYKENVVTIKDGLKIVNQLNPVTFDWKNKDKGSSAGVIAQELEKILPDLVYGENYDESKPDIMGKSVTTSGLVGYLIKAVQELSAKVEALEKE